MTLRIGSVDVHYRDVHRLADLCDSLIDPTNNDFVTVDTWMVRAAADDTLLHTSTGDQTYGQWEARVPVLDANGNQQVDAKGKPLTQKGQAP